MSDAKYKLINEIVATNPLWSVAAIQAEAKSRGVKINKSWISEVVSKGRKARQSERIAELLRQDLGALTILEKITAEGGETSLKGIAYVLDGMGRPTRSNRVTKPSRRAAIKSVINGFPFWNDWKEISAEVEKRYGYPVRSPEVSGVRRLLGYTASTLKNAKMPIDKAILEQVQKILDNATDLASAKSELMKLEAPLAIKAIEYLETKEKTDGNT